MKVLKKGTVYASDALFGFGAWPTIAKMPDGSLGVAFSGDRIRHICPFGKTLLTTSSDGGLSWSKPVAVVDTPFDDRDGGITVRGDQVLVASFNNNFAFQESEARKAAGVHLQRILDYIEQNKEADENDIGSCLAVSEDGGKTFAKRYLLPISAPHGPIVLRDGRYCYVGRAFSIEDKYKTAGKKYDELTDGIYISYSEDGYEWSEPQSLFGQTEEWFLCEPHVIEKRDGELLVHIRVHNRKDMTDMRTFQTVSSENRTKWSDLQDLGVCGSPPHLLRHSSGAIVCVYGRRRKPYGEMAIVSYDDGKTWSEPFCFDGESLSDDLGYPASVEMEDGSIFTVYYQHEKENEKNKIEYTLWEI